MDGHRKGVTLKPNPDLISPSIRIDRRLEKKRARSVASLPQTRGETEGSFLLSDLIASLSHALDVSEGHEQEHALRTCVIGMRVGIRLALDPNTLSDLFYALLLKDIGASSTSAQIHHVFGRDDDHVRKTLRRVDFGRLDEGAKFMFWQLGSSVNLSRRLRYLFELGLGRFNGTAPLIRTRAERGSQLIADMGFSPQVADAVHAADEHHDGSGGPRGLVGEDIPLLARIVALAQAVEQRLSEGGVPAVTKLLATRTGSWFDPTVAAALGKLHDLPGLWEDLGRDSVWHAITEVAPVQEPLALEDERFDAIAEVFSRVIDAKSPWTHRHSARVRDIAVGMLAQLPELGGDPAARRRALRRGALLHDIGTLGISNSVLDKNGELTPQELETVKLHTAYSEHILSWTGPFNETVPLAAGHHERLDGRGYHGAVPAALLDFDTRLLAVADQFEALTSARPHRDAFDTEAALGVLAADAGSGIDPAALAALERYLASPSAGDILAPREFDPEQLVVIA